MNRTCRGLWEISRDKRLTKMFLHILFASKLTDFLLWRHCLQAKSEVIKKVNCFSFSYSNFIFFLPQNKSPYQYHWLVVGIEICLMLSWKPFELSFPWEILFLEVFVFLAFYSVHHNTHQRIHIRPKHWHLAVKFYI